MMSSEDQRAKLAEELTTVDWPRLRPHAARDHLFIVRPGLDLLEAGVALANDDAAAVQGWIDAGLLTRPERDEMRRWQNEGATFSFLILAPFVLASPCA